VTKPATSKSSASGINSLGQLSIYLTSPSTLILDFQYFKTFVSINGLPLETLIREYCFYQKLGIMSGLMRTTATCSLIKSTVRGGINLVAEIIYLINFVRSILSKVVAAE
jgi:hypothetical protein